MTRPLQDQTVLIIGNGGGIARAVAIVASGAGPRAVSPDATPNTLAGVSGASATSRQASCSP
jgi:siroheme synthase (precorrin-2 oxidase/ferrochelatase)